MKYVITVFVSTVFFPAALTGAAAGCEESGPQATAPAPAETDPAAAPDPSVTPPGEGPPTAQEEPLAPGSRHEANGISFTDLVDASYEDDVSEGIAATRATYPGELSFSVISSPGVVPPDQALELQTTNARRAATSRGPILEDADAAARPFAAGELEGRRIVYQTNGGIMHTEVFAYAAGERTVTVFVELPDPPDLYGEIIDTLTASVRVVAP